MCIQRTEKNGEIMMMRLNEYMKRRDIKGKMIIE